jgi:peroxiredoxin
MVLAINDTAPDFEAETTEGKIRFHDWIGDKWAVLFSHPKRPETEPDQVMSAACKYRQLGSGKFGFSEHRRPKGRNPLCALAVQNAPQLR